MIVGGAALTLMLLVAACSLCQLASSRSSSPHASGFGAPTQTIRTYRYDVSTASNRCSQSPSHSQIVLYEGDCMMGVITPMNLTSYTVRDGSTGKRSGGAPVNGRNKTPRTITPGVQSVYSDENGFLAPQPICIEMCAVFASRWRKATTLCEQVRVAY